MDLAKKIKGKLPHIFGGEEEDDASEQAAEKSAGEQEAESEETGGDSAPEADGEMMHAKDLSKHLKAGDHAGVVAAIKGIMKSGKGDMGSKGAAS
jgi:hypothetical protein